MNFQEELLLPNGPWEAANTTYPSGWSDSRNTVLCGGLDILKHQRDSLLPNCWVEATIIDLFLQGVQNLGLNIGLPIFVSKCNTFQFHNLFESTSCRTEAK
jgi:hypothetical protein